MQTPEIKARLRKRVLELRRELSFEEVYGLSARVQQKFIGSSCFLSSRRLALYSSFNNEVLTDEIFARAAALGKEVYFPRVIPGNGRLAFYRVVNLKDLRPGSYEVPEPAGDEAHVTPGTFDLIVVPGVAFDIKGSRIGFGKGYYDRALTDLKARVVALAYEFQVVAEEIPTADHDVRVSSIVTEERIIETGAGGPGGGAGAGGAGVE
jgi:5-formyltetrahydrofolate cyclo-ligase